VCRQPPKHNIHLMCFSIRTRYCGVILIQISVSLVLFVILQGTFQNYVHVAQRVCHTSILRRVCQLRSPSFELHTHKERDASSYQPMMDTPVMASMIGILEPSGFRGVFLQKGHRSSLSVEFSVCVNMCTHTHTLTWDRNDTPLCPRRRRCRSSSTSHRICHPPWILLKTK
jgi:hypothetical protein